MELHTASEAISFAKQLEGDAAKFYEDLSRRFTEQGDTFLAFAKENGKNATQVERAYYGVISDAIEGCFAFDLEADAYTFKIALADNASYLEAIARAVEIEEKMLNFCLTAAEQSKSLMADVPRAFSLIAKKRSNRIDLLKSFVEQD